MERKTALVWLAAYATMVLSVLVLMDRARQWAKSTYSGVENQADWDDWRDSAARGQDESPVSRRPPRSARPPALVLMQEHYLASLLCVLLLSSALFVALAFMIQGVIRGGHPAVVEEREAADKAND